MKQLTIGLYLITLNEEDNIRKVLESAIDYVDAIYLTDTGSTDKTIEIAERVAKRYKKYLKVSKLNLKPFDFAKARNYNFSTGETDWDLWIDADDTLEGGENLRNNIEVADAKGYTGLTMKYRYQVDEKGIDKVAHPKLRAVKHGMYEWTSKAPIHENLFILPGNERKRREAYTSEVVIRHWKDAQGMIKSGERNLRMLIELEEREKKQGIEDPRTVFLLARENHAMWKISGENKYRDTSEKYINRYMELQKRGGEVMTAATFLFDIYRSQGHIDKCEQAAHAAVMAHPEHPLGYLFVAKYYSFIGNYSEVINWVNQSLRRELSETDPTVASEKGLMREAALLLSEAYMEVHEYEKAHNALKKYVDIADQNEMEELQKRVEIISAEELKHKVMKGFTVMANVALQDNKLDKVMPLIETLPQLLQWSKETSNLKRKIGLADQHPEGTVAIFCGGSFEEWDQDSLKRGLGGSETAVVEMARLWSEAGYKVTVYNGVEESKTFGRVTYTNFQDINVADVFDIFIAWRNPIIASKFNINARKRFLWLHDVPSPLDYPDNVIASYDKIIVLSNHHRNFLPHIPDEKFYISSNGINVEAIAKVEKRLTKSGKLNVREPHKVFYASSPDRGLEYLLDEWPNVLKEVPDAKLYWAYGWDTFDALRKGDPVAMKWKDDMVAKMEKLGVIQLGRIGKDELYEHYLTSQIWAYPTQFDEINCIVSQEAQAGGAYPVCTNFAALKEFVLVEGGKVEDRKDFTAKLIHHLKFNTVLTRDFVEEARKKFSWEVTAKAWMNDLFYGDKLEIKEPLVSVVCITIRPGYLRLLREQVEKQTYKNLELVIVDGRYEENWKEVAEYMKDFKYPYIHVPDVERDKSKYPYGIFHADNAALNIVNGEYIVFLQDFIIMPEDGVEKYVNLFKVYPDALISGVDTRNKPLVITEKNPMEEVAFVNKRASLPRSIDIFKGEKYAVGEEQFKSPRIRIGKAKRITGEPMEWELNYAAAPTSRLKELGGFNLDWDKGFGYDNTEMALRHLYLDGDIVIDETNQCIALSHWDLFDENDSEGVPHRNKKTNDKRYWSYLRFLSQKSDVKVKLRLDPPNYPDNILLKIKKWKKQQNLKNK